MQNQARSQPSRSATCPGSQESGRGGCRTQVPRVVIRSTEVQRFRSQLPVGTHRLSRVPIFLERQRLPRLPGGKGCGGDEHWHAPSPIGSLGDDKSLLLAPHYFIVNEKVIKGGCSCTN